MKTDNFETIVGEILSEQTLCPGTIKIIGTGRSIEPAYCAWVDLVFYGGTIMDCDKVCELVYMVCYRIYGKPPQIRFFRQGSFYAQNRPTAPPNPREPEQPRSNTGGTPRISQDRPEPL